MICGTLINLEAVRAGVRSSLSLSLEFPGATAPISLSPLQFVFPRRSLRRLRVAEFSLFVGQVVVFFFFF